MLCWSSLGFGGLGFPQWLWNKVRWPLPSCLWARFWDSMETGWLSVLPHIKCRGQRGTKGYQTSEGGRVCPETTEAYAFRSTEGRLGAQGSVSQSTRCSLQGYLGCTALVEQGVRVGEDELGTLLGRDTRVLHTVRSEVLRSLWFCHQQYQVCQGRLQPSSYQGYHYGVSEDSHSDRTLEGPCEKEPQGEVILGQVAAGSRSQCRLALPWA